MSTKRRIRTHEERLEDARKELVRLEQETITKAIELRKQSEGWTVRATELVTKAQGAKEKADELLQSIGHDPVLFWKEYEEAEAEAPAEGQE
jgi:uncharacterized protein (DUF342 family)